MFSLPIIAYVLLGPYRGSTLLYLILGSIFDTIGHFLKRVSRLDELEQRARAGQLTDKIDYGDYLNLNNLLSLSAIIAAFAGFIVVYRSMSAVWPWVAHRYPGWSMVMSINNFVNGVPTMDNIARARSIVWYLCWTLPGWLLRELLIGTGFLRRSREEILAMEAAEQRKRAAEGKKEEKEIGKEEEEQEEED